MGVTLMSDDEKLRTVFGTRLKELRKQGASTQKELVSRLGVRIPPALYRVAMNDLPSSFVKEGTCMGRIRQVVSSLPERDQRAVFRLVDTAARAGRSA